MTRLEPCQHKSLYAEGQNWLCSVCKVPIHRRCQEVTRDGKQCCLIQGHETPDSGMGRTHIVVTP